MDPREAYASAADLEQALGRTGYLSSPELSTVTWLSLRLARPLLMEGEPGTGKTALAEALAQALDLPLVRLQCYEGIDATQALYDWDFPRQILHLRAVEASAGGDRGTDLAQVEGELFDERFLLSRPILKALREAPVVLLIDEIDRADDEFEALLLEVLGEHTVTVPELGTFTATVPPIVILTSNRSRELHDALRRRCLYHWIDFPDPARAAQIVRSRVPGASDPLIASTTEFVGRARGLELDKPPGLAETIDWVSALAALGVAELGDGRVLDSVSALAKTPDDRTELVQALQSA